MTLNALFHLCEVTSHMSEYEYKLLLEDVVHEVVPRNLLEIKPAATLAHPQSSSA